MDGVDKYCRMFGIDMLVYTVAEVKNMTAALAIAFQYRFDFSPYTLR